MKLDLIEIEKSLSCLRANSANSIDTYSVNHGSMTDNSIQNMMAGYSNVEKLVQGCPELFSLGQSRHIIELNHIVLYGLNSQVREENKKQIKTSEKQFYEKPYGGIADLIEWYSKNQSLSVWERAAGIQLRVLSTPELFFEGNHRTSTLLMSYELMKSDVSPFVLNSNNVVEYFKFTPLMQSIKTRGILMKIKGPKMRKTLANYLRENNNDKYIFNEVASDNKVNSNNNMQSIRNAAV